METISVARASGSGRLQSLCGNSIGFWVAAEAASLNPFHVTSCHHEVAYATPSRAENCARDRGICFFIAPSSKAQRTPKGTSDVEKPARCRRYRKPRAARAFLRIWRLRAGRERALGYKA